MSDLLQGLRCLWASRRADVTSRWNRTLPFGDYVVDRWEKAQALGFGEGVSIYDTAQVYGDVTVGKNTWIGPFVILDGTGGLRIGSHCSIAAGVQIYTHDSVRWASSGGRASIECAPTAVGDNCYIGPNTIIAKGVSIGDGCVIGTNSLVLHDVPTGSKALGFALPCSGKSDSPVRSLPARRGSISPDVPSSLNLRRSMLLNPDLSAATIRICSRCIYDERVPAIEFDHTGTCNYCRQSDRLLAAYGTGNERGTATLKAIVEDIKRAGRGKKYDCVIGVSGGTDSSFMVYLAVTWGLRPLAVHYDNTWNTAIATQNIRKVLSALGVDLFTHVIDNKESDDIFLAFFRAGVAEIEAATDLALAETMYRAASRYGVRYVLEGHSFVTEGITPVGRNYFDGRYIRSIHRRFGHRRMASYPLMTFSRFLWWSSVARIRKIRPFWYIEYSKEAARTFLEREFGWQYYGGHHLENRMTAFYHSIYLPAKFGTDMRNNSWAALARTGRLSREEAWARYNTGPVAEDELLRYFKKRLGLSDAEYDRIMNEPPRSWRDYPTYKRRFERLRPLFAVLAKANLVPMSFYLKYCFPVLDSE